MTREVSHIPADVASAEALYHSSSLRLKSPRESRDHSHTRPVMSSTCIVTRRRGANGAQKNHRSTLLTNVGTNDGDESRPLRDQIDPQSPLVRTPTTLISMVQASASAGSFSPANAALQTL